MAPHNLTNILAGKGYSISDQLLCFKIILGLKNVFFYKEANKYFLLVNNRKIKRIRTVNRILDFYFVKR